MAIEKVKKVHLLGFTSIKKQLLKELQEKEIIHLEGISPASLEESSSGIVTDRGLEKALMTFSLYEEKNFLGELFPQKHFVNKEEIQHLSLGELSLIIKRVLKLSQDKEELSSRIKEFEDTKKIFSEISFIDASLESLLSFRHFTPLFLKINKKTQRELEKIVGHKDCLLKEIGLVGKGKISFLLIKKDSYKEVLSDLQKRKITILELPVNLWKEYYKKSPDEIIAYLNNKISQDKSKIREIENKIKEHLIHQKRLMLLYDFLLNEKFKSTIEGNLPATKNFFFLEGWILASQEKRFLAIIKKFKGEARVFLREPHRKEAPPTRLRNRRMVEPFEVIVNMYGVPNPFSLDPTIFVALFFFLFVGICISDAGYGIILALISLYILRKKKLTQGGRKFFKLLSFIGFSTTFCGAVLGGIFGITLPFKLVDMINSPLPFLLFCFFIGFVQVLLGILLRAYLDLKNKKYQKSLSQLSWAGLLVSLVLFFILKTTLLKILCFIFTGGILLFSSSSKNIFARLGLGLYELYGITRYFSDVLSYSRLLALGMATGIIAMVINILAGLAFKIPIVGFLLGVSVLLGGHIFNLLINLMSGFIHSMRLQFYEFFSKFFEFGDEFFEPFKIKTKYTNLCN
jgi:V/A-type H+-transporting ATPase subunit I